MSEQDDIIREQESQADQPAELDEAEWGEGEIENEPMPGTPSEVQT